MSTYMFLWRNKDKENITEALLLSTHKMRFFWRNKKKYSPGTLTYLELWVSF